jgi:putative phosphoribosyl transferase
MTVVGHGVLGPAFQNRSDAGRRLAKELEPLASVHPLVLALPRGGVPVAAEVARSLGAPLDVIVVRKLGVPFQPELGFGAIGEGGIRILDRDLIRRAQLTGPDVANVEAKERRELDRRVHMYRGERPPPDVVGRTVVIVDDGLATGGTARAAVQVARAMGARQIVLAVPVAPPDTVRELEGEADRVICLVTPTPFFGVGQWYEDFTQTSDEEVAELLVRAGSGTEQSSDPAPVSPG